MQLIFLLLPLFLCGCSSDPAKDGAEITRIKTRDEIVKERSENWGRIAANHARKTNQ